MGGHEEAHVRHVTKGRAMAKPEGKDTECLVSILQPLDKGQTTASIWHMKVSGHAEGGTQQTQLGDCWVSRSCHDCMLIAFIRSGSHKLQKWLLPSVRP